MLYIAFLAERWLQTAPGGALDYESGEAEAAIASLAEGWGSTAVHPLAREPMTLPLLELPGELAGRLRLAVEIGEEGDPHGLAGVTARVEAGRVVACERRLDQDTETWAQASAGDWLDTLIEPDAKRVRTGGDRVLPAVLLGKLHEVLFGVRVGKPGRSMACMKY